MEIYINPNEIDNLMKSYEKENTSFIIKSFLPNDAKRRCNYFIDGKEGTIDFYIKKNGRVNVLPTGKNIEYAKKIMDFIKEKSMDATISSETYTIKFNEESLNKLLKIIEFEYKELIQIIIIENRIQFKGYNGDMVTFNYYESSSKLVIQAKPLRTYDLLMNAMAKLDEIDMNTIMEMTNAVSPQQIITPESIRDEIKEILPNVYNYLDEPLIKSLASSLTLLLKDDIYEDYTGHVAGIFKVLEGYLRKVLNKEYNYSFDYTKNFNMFNKSSKDMYAKSEIDTNPNLSPEKKHSLNRLYKLYKNERNVYLHSSLEESSKKSIIESIEEARNITKNILNEINDSYDILVKNN